MRLPDGGGGLGSAGAARAGHLCYRDLGAHPDYYGGTEKAARAKADPSGRNPFVDPDGYRRYVDNAERTFRERLARERK